MTYSRATFATVPFKPGQVLMLQAFAGVLRTLTAPKKDTELHFKES